jgi:hypothetical protein
MTLIYGVGLLAALIIVWIAVRRGRQRRRLKKYRQSWATRPTVLRIKGDLDRRARDPDLQTRPPTYEDGRSSSERRRK